MSFLPKRLKSEKGQATIMIGMMMSTFILFFAFVVNTGMLVNARINLQNAADMAAFAGAAVQARQLTQASFLNYEMRRAYKKFLFRYYVLGNLAQDAFPKDSSMSGADPYDFSPDYPSTKPHLVPSVCVAFNVNNNFCKNPNLQSVLKGDYAIRAQVGLMSQALYDMASSIEDARKQNCVAIGMTNKQILLLWLFNADLNSASISPTGPQDQDFKNTARSVEVMTRGLGLVPRLALLSRRMTMMENYLNNEPMSSVTYDRARALADSPTKAAQSERTIQAFFSAYRTLGTHSFPGDAIKVDELIPARGSDLANMVKFQPMVANFDTYALEFGIGDCTNQSNPEANAKDCVACPSPFAIKKVTVGYYKDPSVLTYYAVRVKARAKLLFSIFGDIEMTAYAAARPFGSRIGPQFSGNDAPPEFLATKSNPIFCASGGNGCFGKIPNLPVKGEDLQSPDLGWYRKDALLQFYDNMKALSAGTGAAGLVSQLGPGNIEKGTHFAQTPNPAEIGRYNFPHDWTTDDAQPAYWMEQFFDSTHVMSIWAPLVPPGASDGELEKILEATVDDIIQVAGDKSKSAFNLKDLSDAIKDQLKTYMGRLKKGDGEENESMNVARIVDPFRSRPDATVDPNGKLNFETYPDMQVKAAQRAQARTSWNTEKDAELTAINRVGYSVKFVSFDSLSKTRTNLSGSTPANISFGNGDANEDIRKLKH